jgi:hypothetical protein
MVLCFFVWVGAAAAQSSAPIRIDNSDGCGDQRAAVEVGRDSIRRDRFYKETDRWFQDRLAALQKCVDEIPLRRTKLEEERRKYDARKNESYATAQSILAWSLGLGFPLALFLSYAQSAGIAGNAALVRLRDWKGSPMFLWAACAAASVGLFATTWFGLGMSYDVRPASMGLSGLVTMVVSALLACLAIGLALDFVRNGLWSTLKGIAILIHYLFARHPAQTHLPAHVTDALVRRDFGRVMREHGIGIKGFWRELITPRFVRRHQLEKAAQVKAQLDADVAILKSAIERESARAAYLDKRDNA